MAKNLLFFSTIIFLTSCTSPSYYFKEKNYTKSYNLALKKIIKKPKKTLKYEKILLNSFAALNAKDVYEVTDESNINNNFDAKLLKIDNIKKRQGSLSDVSYFLNIKDVSNLTSWVNADSIYDAISYSAYKYYRTKYERNFDSLENNKIKFAPVLSTYVSKMEKYNSAQHDYSLMYLDVISRGVLKTNVSFANYAKDDEFENLIDDYALYNMSNQWFLYYQNEKDSSQDRNFVIEIGDVDPGEEFISTNHHSYTNTVIDYYNEVCVQVEVPQPDKRETRQVMQGDSMVEIVVCVPQPPKIVTEIRQEPVYVTVNATVTKTTVSKVATAKVYFTLENNKDKSIIYEKENIIYNNYAQTYTDVCGDTRALPYLITSTFMPSPAPSDEQMIKQLSKIVYKTIHTQVNAFNKAIIKKA